MTVANKNIITPSIFILVLMISLGPFGDTIYAPSLPNIALAFNTAYQNVQLTITFYLLGYSIGQLLYGPFSDRFGRKPILILGASSFFIGSAICLLSPNITILITGRFVQGFGACAGAVISSAAVRDAFAPQEQGRVFAKMNTAFAIAPGLGAIIGTFISWQMNFSILFILSIILLIAVIVLFPETIRKYNNSAIKPKPFVLNYFSLFRTTGYLSYLLILGLNIGMVYSCLVEAPAIVITTLKLDQTWFIVIAIGIVMAFMIGSIICTKLCRKIKADHILFIGMLISLVGSIMFIAFVIFNIINLISFLIPIIIIFTGISFVIPIATAQSLAPFNITAGSASAMMGFFQMGMASLITIIVTSSPLTGLMTLPVSFITLSILAILVLYVHILRHS